VTVAVSDLEEAAFLAVQAVHGLRDGVAQAQAGCDESLKHVTELSARLASDREGLAEAVSGLEESVTRARQRLFHEGKDVELALQSLAGQAASVDAQARAPLEAESSGLSGLAEHTGEVRARLEELAAAADSASQAAVARASEIEAAVEQLVEQAEHMVSVDLPAWIVELGREVEASVQRATAFLSELCPALLADKEKDWDAKMAEARATLDKTFTDMHGHAEELVAYALESCADLVGAAVDDAQTQVATLEVELTELGRSVTSTMEDLAPRADALADAARDVAADAHAVAEGLTDTLGRWSRWGFGR
jgi:hypothetical protein